MAHRHFIEVDEQFRRRLDDLIDRLIEVADTLDGDADNEPSLGSPERSPHALSLVGGIARDGTASQEHWSDGQDLEDDEVRDDLRPA